MGNKIYRGITGSRMGLSVSGRGYPKHNNGDGRRFPACWNGHSDHFNRVIGSAALKIYRTIMNERRKYDGKKSSVKGMYVI